jgi:hypothetical protein
MSDISQGFVLDVFYRDSKLVEHTFLLEVNSSSMTWKLTDVRLNATGSGSLGPPGINTGVGSITGTAFWNRDKSTTWFVLKNFLAIPYYPNKYPPGGAASSGTGTVITTMPGFDLGSTSLKWAVGTMTVMGTPDDSTP